MAVRTTATMRESGINHGVDGSVINDPRSIFGGLQNIVLESVKFILSVLYIACHGADRGILERRKLEANARQ